MGSLAKNTRRTTRALRPRVCHHEASLLRLPVVALVEQVDGGRQLSGGEQQMPSIGRALMTNPDLLILDEATEGLAPLISREIWRIISQIRETGIATVIVDKNHAAVTGITDRNVILVKGQVVYEGSSDELRARPDILQKHLSV
jgi:branched-chain amino acid transport system ATP-binding protein